MWRLIRYSVEEVYISYVSFSTPILGYEAAIGDILLKSATGAAVEQLLQEDPAFAAAGCFGKLAAAWDPAANG
jgi:hypothetical protein